MVNTTFHVAVGFSCLARLTSRQGKNPQRLLWSGYLVILWIRSLGAMTLQVTSSPPTPQPVGTPITWTATVNATESGTLDYQFSGKTGTYEFRVLQDFQTSNQLVWAVTETEGTYTLRVIARNRNSGTTATTWTKFTVTSLLTTGDPVITATANPLVAIYSAPGCAAGDSMYIRFDHGGKSSTTNLAPCTPGSSRNFYMGGMLPGTTYYMKYAVVTEPNKSIVTSSSKLPFTTGQIDPSQAFPMVTVLHPPDSQTCAGQETLLLDYLSPPGGPYYCPTAVDLQGRTIWYYPALALPAQTTTYFIRPVPNSQGHMLLIANDPDSIPDKGQFLREIDLAGNTVAQTNARRISEQLIARGELGITGFDHDAIRLPNGHTLVICSQERIFAEGTQGASGPVNILGNAIVDLDKNWQVTWSWSAYDHLDINRVAVLGEICSDMPGCPPFTLSPNANDWLHGNSLGYIPESGNILFSIRNQDWVIKIDYAQGRGSGSVLWKLGLDGDFTMNSADPYPWFSHQHDAHFELGRTILTLFDNGNTRATRNPNMLENSRGYVLQVDEANHTATPLLLADLGVYSQAVGTAQKLENGNYHFEAGYVKTPSNQAFAIEVLPDGGRNFECQDATQTYRAYRMQSLYAVGSDRVVRPAAAPGEGQLGLDDR